MENLHAAIDSYVSRGFGSMTKNDFEVWIFYYLLQHQMEGKSNYEISLELQIPETKVKRLRYEACLKYEKKTQDSYVADFLRIVTKAKFKKDGEHLQFAIEDVQLRKFLDSVLKRDGRFSNTTFNSEIVTLDYDDFSFLMQSLLSEETKKELEKEARKVLNKKVTFHDLMIDIQKGAYSQMGSKLVDLSIQGIKHLLPVLINII